MEEFRTVFARSDVNRTFSSCVSCCKDSPNIRLPVVNDGIAEEKNHEVLMFRKKLDEEGTLIETDF